MLMAMGLARFQLDLQPGAQRIVVNDQEVADVVSVQVHAGAADVPHVVIVKRGEGTIEGEGIVQVQPEVENAKAQVLAWLEALDGDQLERQALDQQGWGSGGLGNEILSVLKQLAEAQL